MKKKKKKKWTQIILDSMRVIERICVELHKCIIVHFSRFKQTSLAITEIAADQFSFYARRVLRL